MCFTKTRPNNLIALKLSKGETVFWAINIHMPCIYFEPTALEIYSNKLLQIVSGICKNDKVMYNKVRRVSVFY